MSAAGPLMVYDAFAVVGMVGLLALALGLLGLALWRPRATRTIGEDATSWSQYRFGFAVVSLVFVAFDMEMIFMYPWAVVFADVGLKAFLDMFVFIALLGGGIAYAWGMGGLRWE